MLAVSVASTSSWPMPLGALSAIVLPRSWLTVRIDELAGIISSWTSGCMIDPASRISKLALWLTFASMYET